ncbi:hypothetical protein [Paludisphaera soli]|uniref:hypothetical protein n=1 Tax=Paludisphaera soli TaxID=2712865 RepID=UPI0013EB459A|nr:hypothetical protein [Paludisphaera soli]
MLTNRTDRPRNRSLVSLAARLVPAALVVAAVVGCGDSSEPPRLPVSGKVTLDGKPLPAGQLTFVPLDGRTASVAEVRDGAFQTDGSTGPAPGRYQVEIYAVESTGKTIPSPDIPGATIEEERDLVPERYNVKSELTAEVKPDGDNAYEFALTSQAPAARKVRRR